MDNVQEISNCVCNHLHGTVLEKLIVVQLCGESNFSLLGNAKVQTVFARVLHGIPS
jgi:hypothetical protein